MCWLLKKGNRYKVYSVHSSNSGIDLDEEQNEISLPEHVDDPFLNRNVQHGILGFRYKTKNSTFVVYSSIEAKTFCLIMKLTPMKH